MKKRLESRVLLFVLLLALFCVLLLIRVQEKAKGNRLKEDSGRTEEFRKIEMDEIFEKVLKHADPDDRGKLYALYYLENQSIKDQSLLNDRAILQKWASQKDWQSFEQICNAIWNDVHCFPVPESTRHPEYRVNFSDSWMSERTYGGKRGHEGCDLIASEDIPGLYPVVSMTDGKVTALGWLEKGGYRIGISAPSGAYFYYAHLDSYGNFRENDMIRAGDIIGFMGNTGYGPEGTKGMFATHLHLGIYLYLDGEEISYNPYWILRLAGEKKLSCSF